ncbi:TIGR04282 family arsenosugar biosynthesis glycosyltransferase [Roseovarius atlanticus]|uniref:TIGR04282 family arsenosugar biosynthesis glycosyltransferase n=1 Tax=Roseovarius atlanticus TaxID=1641875 RepID=UPI001C970A1C|nr:TIGR04282 family arsenosugar biosynthesis glycosyltransferase [Roseovarius atlanticus]MBY5986680.1 TIGR04282 family arsenosugar biosynthesis glycosyltransferase [Roseovarius atlanticus]MBY6125320.1 TIGR04282 family arsenosugar biosynthesis glycosyltransferase [Roseovarius atlanticus]MBY6150219.1 TIGR04282 family arsenosugar biosynthesis glycosyltransferase [Roseovarius atlanticus]
MRRQLVVMLKEPRPGRVKTRLARDIGQIAATWWVRHQTARLLRRLRDPRWDLVLAVAPDAAGLTSRAWPDDLERMPQGPGNLGDRMARVMRTRPPGPVCIIGGDIPGITPAHIARAFASLGRNDAVFGPAPDGGYWLVGMKRTRAVPASFLQGVRWSTEHALADSRATLPDARIGLVDTLQDVDTADDLRAP